MFKVIKINNDSQLIKQSLQNKKQAQKLLYEKYAPKMLSLCNYYIKDLQQAEEVMLNGFLKVFTKLNQYENKGSFEGWIMKIMVFECISYLRKKNQLVFTDNIEIFETIIENEVELKKSIVTPFKIETVHRSTIQIHPTILLLPKQKRRGLGKAAILRRLPAFRRVPLEFGTSTDKLKRPTTTKVTIFKNTPFTG